MVLKTLPTDRYHVEANELKDDPHHLAPLLREAIRYARPERILDATAGSGITARIADDEIIPCTSSDLHAGDGLATDDVDATNEDGPTATDLFAIDETSGYDLVVYHPDLWRSRPDAEHPHDLGAVMTWDSYGELNRDALAHLTTQLRPGGHLLAILPVARYKGTTHTLARDLQCLLGAPTQPEIVHPHPYCRSRGTLYGKRFVPIAHDNVLLWTKEELEAGLEDPRTVSN